MIRQQFFSVTFLMTYEWFQEAVTLTLLTHRVIHAKVIVTVSGAARIGFQNMRLTVKMQAYALNVDASKMVG